MLVGGDSRPPLEETDPSLVSQLAGMPMPNRHAHAHAPPIILKRWPLCAHKRDIQDAAKRFSASFCKIYLLKPGIYLAHSLVCFEINAFNQCLQKTTQFRVCKKYGKTQARVLSPTSGDSPIGIGIRRVPMCGIK